MLMMIVISSRKLFTLAKGSSPKRKEQKMSEEFKEAAKAEALDLAEDVTNELIEHVFNFAKAQLEKAENPLLKTLVPILDQVEAYLCSLADKIDGEEG